MQEILVVGGAGYIGSHMVAELQAAGYDPVVLDDLSSGREDFVGDAELIGGDCGDADLLNDIFSSHKIDAVMHFASSIQVGESVKNPIKYYKNNLINTLTLLNAVVRHDVPDFIFSSSAAVYGEPEYTPVDEQHPCLPLSPYGRSKYFIEQILQDYKKAYGLHYGSLRYFNAAGAHPELPIGEQHEPETHLIPLALQVASGQREYIEIFGSDYDNPDGTCIRDYVHVCDIASAHLKLFDYLKGGGNESVFNLGVGEGYSVMEVIKMVKHVTGQEVEIHYEDRREGDPAILVADGSKAIDQLGWDPEYSDLQTIIEDAWKWEQNR